MKIDYRLRRFKYNIVNGSARRLIKIDFQMRHKTPFKERIDFDYDTFMNIQRDLIKKRHFLAAQLFAESMLKDVADDDSDSTGCYQILKMRKHIWDGNMSAALSTGERIKSRLKKGSEHYDRLSTICYGLLGGKFEETEFSKQYPYFEELYKDKKIAVIGPAIDEEYNIDEINRLFDVIVIFNHSKSGTICDYKKRSDIKVVSYYHSDNYYKVIENDRSSILELDGAVLPCDGIDVINSIIKDDERKKYRPFLNFDGLLMGGVFNLAQHIMVDLIQFRPREIKLYGCNLFLDKHEKPYQHNYISNDHKAMGQNLFDSFAFHVLGLNYEILHLMYKNNFFNSTKMVDEVLSLGTHEYLRKMENRYL